MRVLGLERTLPPEASAEDVYALLCAAGIQSDARAQGGSSNLRIAIAPDRPRRPNEPVRVVLHAPATALYQLTVEGAGLQRWVVDGHPVGHLDVSPLGVAQAAAVVPLREGPHEISGYLAGQARADRVELSAYRSLCIAPADGWHGERSLRHGPFARTLVRTFDLDRRLPVLDEETVTIEGERYEEVTAGGGTTERRLETPASGGRWAVAEASPAEFTWHVELDAPRVVTFRARTFGVRDQIWTVDGRSRVTITPDAIEGAFTWTHVVTLPLSAGRHSLRALISRGAGVDAIEMQTHRSDDAAYAGVLAGLGMGGAAPAAPVRVARMQAMLESQGLRAHGPGLPAADGRGSPRPAAGARRDGARAQSHALAGPGPAGGALSMRRTPFALLLVALLWLPSIALGDGPEAGFWWTPSLRVTGVVDDNIFFKNANENGDVGFWIAPRMEAGYSGQAFAVGADVGVDVRQYLDDGGINDQQIRATGWGEVSLAPGLDLKLQNAYVPQAVILGLPDDDTLNNVQTNRADASLQWSHQLVPGRSFTIGAVGTHFLAEEHADALPAAGGGFAVDPSFRGDFLQGLAFLQVDASLAERTTLWARTQASYRDFSELSSADHTNVSMLLGIESRYWRGVELSASLGGGAVLFDGLGTGYRAVARARGLKRFEQGLSIWLGGRHLRSPDLRGDEVAESRGEIGFEQRFGSATALDVRGFVTYYDAAFVGGANLFGGAEVRLRRQLTRHLQVGVTYRYWGNGGRFAADDFSQNRVALEIGFRL